MRTLTLIKDDIETFREKVLLAARMRPAVDTLMPFYKASLLDPRPEYFLTMLAVDPRYISGVNTATKEMRDVFNRTIKHLMFFVQDGMPGDGVRYAIDCIFTCYERCREDIYPETLAAFKDCLVYDLDMIKMLSSNSQEDVWRWVREYLAADDEFMIKFTLKHPQHVKL